MRELFALRPAPARWSFAVRSTICMGVPVAAGVAAGDTAAGLMATMGAFTSLYGGGRPYAYRALMLAWVAVGMALAVGLGLAASSSHALALATVTAIAMAATLLCRALETGPPGAYLFALACAAGTAMPAEHLTPWHAAALVGAGGAFSWAAHMVGALVRPRQPETNAVLIAARDIAAFIRALGTPAQAEARHRAAGALHDAWSALVTYQPAHRRVDATLGALRTINRELHLLFAQALSRAERNEPMPEALPELRRLATLARDPREVVPTQGDEIPLGRMRAADALREALQPGSMSLLVVVRVGIAAIAAGLLGGAMALEHAYWSIAAAVLVLHFGFDWRRTVQRGLERLLGTWVGLLLAGAVLAAHPQGAWLVATIMALQFTLEMIVLRNYALAVVFITALALLQASGGAAPGDLRELLLARGIDTTLGCTLGIAVFALLRSRGTHRVRDALDAVRDAMKPVEAYLASGDVTSRDAREARRLLQHRLFALSEAYDGGVGGMARERRETEALWPDVAAAQTTAYRILEQCWRIERDESSAA